MQLEKIPASLKLAGLVGLIMAGPMVFLGFYIGGAVGGAVAVVLLFFYFIIIYMISFRKSI